MLETREVSAKYGDIEILRGVGIKVKEGQIVSIVGANAAGKSTLLGSIAGLVPLTGGMIEFGERRIESLPPFKRVELGIILVPEGRKLFSSMTVQENLDLGSYSPEARKNHNETLRMIFEMLPILRQKRDQKGGALSGGEQQMCAIGRALMARPKLMMLDEPSLGLSPIMTREIFAKIRELNRNGTMILLVEQDVYNALRMAHVGYVLEGGRITLEGRGEDLLANESLRKAYMGM